MRGTSRSKKIIKSSGDSIDIYPLSFEKAEKQRFKQIMFLRIT